MSEDTASIYARGILNFFVAPALHSAPAPGGEMRISGFTLSLFASFTLLALIILVGSGGPAGAATATAG